MQNLSFFRGDCLARLGRDAEARRPHFPGARDSRPIPLRTALALLYASQGREGDARRSLTQLVADLRTPEAYFAAARTYEVLGDPHSAEELRSEARRIFPKARERKETS
jgi:Tfp pilus assembly protein PilF